MLNLSSQLAVEFSTTLTLVLSAVLATFLTKNYFQKRMNSYLFWSLGLWLFTLSVGEELLFSAGYYDELLIATYLGVVAFLVEFLALGSMQLIKGNLIKKAYYAYSIASAVALVYFLATENIGNILNEYVVYGALPLGIIITSSLITFPAAAVLMATAALTYKKTRNRRMLSIIAGVTVVSVAGSLYIDQFPALLYYAEFIGILLLWFGFFEFSFKKKGNKEKDFSHSQPWRREKKLNAFLRSRNTDRLDKSKR